MLRADKYKIELFGALFSLKGLARSPMCEVTVETLRFNIKKAISTKAVLVGCGPVKLNDVEVVFCMKRRITSETKKLSYLGIDGAPRKVIRVRDRERGGISSIEYVREPIDIHKDLNLDPLFIMLDQLMPVGSLAHTVR